MQRAASVREESGHPVEFGSRIVVLGIGNLLWADEGFGVRCVEALDREWHFAADVVLVDGGTQGLHLIDYVLSADRLLVFDAVDYGLAPGTLKLLHDEEVPRYLGVRKLSLHQTGFQEVLELARLIGQLPREMVLIGCQPQTIDDYGGKLRPVVMAALLRAMAKALEILTVWGACPLQRDAPPSPHDAVVVSALGIGTWDVALEETGGRLQDQVPEDSGRMEE